MTAQRAALETMGLDHQLARLAEECAELAQAALRLRRLGPDPKRQANLIEGLADVEIMIEQMRIHFGDDGIDGHRSKTLTRLESRLGVPPIVGANNRPRGITPSRKGFTCSKPVMVGDKSFRSMSKAAEYLGICNATLTSRLRKGGGSFDQNGYLVAWGKAP